MTAVMSHWSGGYNGVLDKTAFESIHLAMLLAQKHFGEVHLITDSPSELILKRLPWASISLSLDGVGENRSHIFSLGKMYAIAEAARRFGSFIHIDNDCFLWKKPNENILAEGVFCLCDEIMNDSLINETIRKNFHPYSESIDPEADWMPNMALCGGVDSRTWIEYFEVAKQIIFDPRMEAFWTTKPQIPFHKAVLAEQWMLAAFMRRRGQKIGLFFPNEESPRARFCNITTEDAAKFGLSHTAHLKRTPEIVARISARLAKNPPDLEMRPKPTMPQMVMNFWEASKMYAQDGFKNVDKGEHARRLKICLGCDLWNAEGYMGMGKCLKCGCSGLKLWVASSKCPIGKW